MASIIPIYNQNDPGTNLLPFDYNVAKRKTNKSLFTRIGQQRGENEARWQAAAISCNFRAGSYDGTSYTAFPSLVRAKSEFVCNIIERRCLWVSGYQRQNRKDFELTALNQSYARVCDQRNKVLKYFSGKNQFAEQFSEACDAAMTEGFVLIEPYLKPNALFQCNPCLHVWHSCDFITDSYFRKADLSDCSYIATSQLMPAEEAECTFSWVDPSIFYSSGAGTNPFYFQPFSKSYPHSPDVCHVVRLWNRAVVVKHYAVNTSTGEMIPLQKPLTKAEVLMLSDQIGSLIEHRKSKEVGWKLSIYVNGQVIVDDLVNPLGHSDCPMVPLFWRHNPTAQDVAMRFPSLPAQLQDAQYLSDRRICMTHDILEGRSQGGWMYAKGSIDDEDLLWSGQNVANIPFDPAFGPPIPISPTVVPESTLQMIEQLRRFADEASPVGENLMGINPQEGQSGIKTMLEQGAGLVGMRSIFDGWDRALRLTGGLIDKMIVHNMSKQEVQMILGDQEEVDPKFFNLSEGAASVAITEGLYTDSQKKTQFNQWLEFCQLTGTQLPPEAWAKVAPMQKSDEIMALLAEQQKQGAQAAQEAKDYELAMARAKVAETNAVALDRVAMANERNARARSNIGLQDERESEVNKNNAIYAKNVVDSLVRLMEARAAFSAQDQEQSSGALEEMRRSIDQNNQERAASVASRGDNISLLKDQMIVENLSQIQPKEPQNG